MCDGVQKINYSNITFQAVIHCINYSLLQYILLKQCLNSYLSCTWLLMDQQRNVILYAVCLCSSSCVYIVFTCVALSIFYPRDAMPARSLLSSRVCLSHAGIVSKRTKISSNFIRPCSPTTMVFYYQIWLRNINGKGSLSPGWTFSV